MGLGSLIAGLAASAISAASNASKNKGSSSSSSSSGSSSGSKKPTLSSNLHSSVGNVMTSDEVAQAEATMNKNSSSGSSSSGSSGGSSGSSSSSSGGYKALGTWEDQGLKESEPGAYNQLQDYKKQWEEASARGDTAGMQAAHDAAEALRRQYGYLGGTDGSQYIPVGGSSADTDRYTSQLESGYDRYVDYMQQAAEQQKAAIQASIDSAVADLNAQRNQVGKLTSDNNAAAERAYMQTINPNGSLAENLAANGLLSSGLTETSQISAGNTYQDALNENATTQTEAIAEIERAITQARLTGDIEAANALSNMLQQIAEKGYQNVQDIVSAGQWQQDFALGEAGVTGSYNGQPTMEAQQLELQKQEAEDQHRLVEQQLALGQIDQETARKQLELLEREIQKADQEIQSLKLQNRYYEMQI